MTIPLTTLALIGFVGPIAAATLSPLRFRFPRVRYTRNGGMSFLRVGRVQLSWCMCKRAI